MKTDGIVCAVQTNMRIKLVPNARVWSRLRGRLGESVAAAYLRCRGYRVILRNARSNGVEVDIVAWRRGVLYIIEVKTRATHRYGGAAAAVDRLRRRRQWQAAIGLIQRSPLPVDEVSFGVVAIEGVRLRFLPNAWDSYDVF